MFEVRNEAGEAEIILYDRIGKQKDFWTGDEKGVSAEEFRAAIKELSPKPLNIRIDSGGGDVFEGFAMCSAIQEYKGKTTAYVDGLAASAASYIAVVCDEVKMNDYALIMIHCASSWGSGNARAFEDLAARLRNTDENLASIYEKRSSLTIDQVIDYMNEEKWFSAAEAKECGLCTEVIETEQRMVACIDAEFAKAYRHVPQSVELKKTGLANRSEKPQGTTPSHQLPIIPKKVLDQNEVGYRVLAGKLYRKETHEL